MKDCQNCGRPDKTVKRRVINDCGFDCCQKCYDKAPANQKVQTTCDEKQWWEEKFAEEVAQ